jgi:hypothetical protein
MAKSIPNYLRLFQERLPDDSDDADDAGHGLDHLRRSFERATGWPFECVSVDSVEHGGNANLSVAVAPGVPSASARLACTVPDLVEGGVGRIERDRASDLAAAVSELLVELTKTRRALWHREADLAAGVPLVPRPSTERHFADRLAAVLRGGAETIGCDAAGLYLLDETTSALKLRSCWNLPPDRFISDARPLAGATADLEALAGHAVVLENADAHETWNPPEPFSAAVCVPVSSSTTPLGTLWVYSRHARPFHDREVHVAEIVAGRLAGDLEREVLLGEAADAARSKRQWAAAERWQQNQIPRIAPLVDEWDVAGWTQAPDAVGGAFFDWFVRTDDSLAVAVADMQSDGLEAALAASALRAALRSHAYHVSPPRQLLELVNRTIWTGSAGERGASLFYATPTCPARSGLRACDGGAGALHFASAGDAGAYLVSKNGWQSLLSPSLALGLSPNTAYAANEMRLEPCEALLVVSERGRLMLEVERRLFGDEPLAQLLVEHVGEPAAVLAEVVRDRLEALTGKSEGTDASFLVLKRRAASSEIRG